jgi:predicted transcriptional regulator
MTAAGDTVSGVTRNGLRKLRERIAKAQERLERLQEVDRADAIVAAQDSGISNREIAEDLGLTKQRVGQIARERRGQ